MINMKIRIQSYALGLLMITIFASAILAGGIVNTKQLADSLAQVVEYKKSMEEMEADGRTVKAKEVKNKMWDLRFDLFKIGKTYTTTSECPVYSWYSGGYHGISLTCWPSTIESELDSMSIRNQFHILTKSDYIGRIGWDKKTKLKSITADKVAATLQEKGRFEVKFQIIDVNMSGDFLVKVLSAKPAAQQSSEVSAPQTETPE
ncbi:hypothetical protein [Turneriella parva]|uniref:Uncharacterized protein n=1 Tax=Turneriella parva (strain ATCC BAA-1111 / DSM 21527 / NCTC 11395 / H) TaxID=869212 RepID=I4B9Z6_TURPD|nr:hypothetical protein [Turneriella parva]AFM14103.1 hypothetical protein Turpa_3466 [Turneriella parva DSM 21527]